LGIGSAEKLGRKDDEGFPGERRYEFEKRSTKKKGAGLREKSLAKGGYRRRRCDQNRTRVLRREGVGGKLRKEKKRRSRS